MKSKGKALDNSGDERPLPQEPGVTKLENLSQEFPPQALLLLAALHAREREG